MSAQNYVGLLNAALAAAESHENNLNIEFDESFNLRVVVHGDDWDERVDQRIARFVLELQATLDRIQSEFFDYTLVKESRLMIKVRHEKGSADLTAEVGKLLRKMVGNLTTTQKTFLIALAVLSVAGYFTTNSILDYKKEIEEKVKDEETKQRLIQVLERQHASMEDYEKPMRSLVHSMASTDTIQLPVSDEPIGKDEAKKLYPRKPRTPSKTDYIDGKYLVHDIAFDEPVSATLERDGVTFKAGILLTSKQLDDFYSEIKRLQLQQGADVELDLQITARYSGSGIREATIVGVGAARDTSVGIDTVVKK